MRFLATTNFFVKNLLSLSHNNHTNDTIEDAMTTPLYSLSSPFGLTHVVTSFDNKLLLHNNIGHFLHIRGLKKMHIFMNVIDPFHGIMLTLYIAGSVGWVSLLSSYVTDCDM